MHLSMRIGKVHQCFILIFFSVILASGDVASKVVIEKRTESVMAFYKGAGDFYLGYITLKVRPSYVAAHYRMCSVWYSDTWFL